MKPEIKSIIEQAAAIINNGGIVAFPTETVYGLGADALNPVAVAKIFEAKNRPFFDPLIVHIADYQMLDRVIRYFPEKALELARTFWPGPLTIVLEKQTIIPDLVTAGLGTVAVRMPASEIALELIRKADAPIAAPSANPFGYISPTCAAHVKNQLGSKADMIIDGGYCAVGIESTIIRFETDTPVILRHGGISVEEIKKISCDVRDSVNSGFTESPGQLPYHYSPEKEIMLVDDISRMPEDRQSGLLAFTDPGEKVKQRFKEVCVLSPKGNLTEAASKLFDCLHYLDAANIKIIYAEKIPESGLGRAIMDRLNKAAAKKNTKQPFI